MLTNHETQAVYTATNRHTVTRDFLIEAFNPTNIKLEYTYVREGLNSPYPLKSVSVSLTIKKKAHQTMSFNLKVLGHDGKDAVLTVESKTDNITYDQEGNITVGTGEIATINFTVDDLLYTATITQTLTSDRNLISITEAEVFKFNSHRPQGQPSHYPIDLLTDYKITVNNVSFNTTHEPFKLTYDHINKFVEVKNGILPIKRISNIQIMKEENNTLSAQTLTDTNNSDFWYFDYTSNRKYTTCICKHTTTEGKNYLMVINPDDTNTTVNVETLEAKPKSKQFTTNTGWLTRIELSPAWGGNEEIDLKIPTRFFDSTADKLHTLSFPYLSGRTQTRDYSQPFPKIKIGSQSYVKVTHAANSFSYLIPVED